MISHSLLLACVLAAVSAAENVPARKLVDLNTPRTFPEIKSADDWNQRARFIREHARVVTGLLPMPMKFSLNARVFDKIERDGYSVEKVQIETFPGFYLGGNLYRPLGQGSGPFPAVLNPHGHWNNGRMADTELGSIAGRCISQARQGMIAFTYDMVGYNDTRQVDHKFGGKPEHQLWFISLMGLQTWNSIRALDFLETLPDVDRERLACTGESGGGTQTFMLGAVDSRLAVQAPIVMVSHSMQGGCLCENAPGLRIDHSNMEIAAAAAPRPQIIVSATGDWTRDTMTVEGPAIASVYQKLGAPEKFRYALFDYDHNYNRTTREAVYGFFNKWLKGGQDLPRVEEVPFKKESDAALKVFPDQLPPNALSDEQLVSMLIAHYKTQTQQQLPHDGASLKQWRDLTTRLWNHVFLIDSSARENFQSVGELVTSKHFFFSTPLGSVKDGLENRETNLTRRHDGSSVKVRLLIPKKKSKKVLAVLLHPEGTRPYLDDAEPAGAAKELLADGVSVLLVGHALAPSDSRPNYFSNYFTTYNRTDIQQWMRDLVTALNWSRQHAPDSKIVLVGEGRAGLRALLATPLADAVVADADQFDDTTDAALLAPDIFVPGLRRLGGFANVAALAFPKPVTIHNTSEKFDLSTLKKVYQGKSGAGRLKIEKSRLSKLTLPQL